MIPPSSSDGDLNESFSGNGSATGTELLAPARATLPAEPMAVWGDASAAWPAEPQQHGINPLEFLQGLKRRWILALGVAGGLSLLVMIAVFLLFPAEQEATAYLRVAPVRPSYIEGGRAKSVSPDEVQRNQQNEMAFCKSEGVLRAVVREPKVLETQLMQQNRGRPVDFLTEELQVGFVPRSDIMLVKLKGPKKEELATIVDEVVRQFLAQGVQEERAKLKKKTVDLREVVRQRQLELTGLRESARKQAEAVGSPTAANAKVMNEILLFDLEKVRRQLADVEAQHSDQVRKFQFAQAQMAEIKRRGASDAMIDEQLARDQIYVDMKAQAAQLEASYRAQAGRAGGQASASIRQLGQAFQESQRQMSDYRRQAGTRVKKALEDQMDSDLRLLRADIMILAQRHKQLQDEAEKKLEDVKKKTSATEDLAAKEETISRLIEFVHTKSAIIGDWDLELMAPDRVEIMQSATSPEGTSQLQRIMLTLGAGLITGCIGLCAVGGWEYLKKRLANVGDVSKHLGLTVVGTVPALPSRAGAKVARGISVEQFDSMLADSIDSIRAALIHGAASDGHRTLLVTSAWEGEGKTTVASQLAASLARCGRRTLLVDADFRNPALHDLFDLGNDAGLCEVLRGEVEPHAAIRETPAANLWLLSAGEMDYRSVQALENDAIGMLFRELKAEYDFVVVDSAPVLAVADPMLIGQHVDGALVSVRLGHSQRPKVDEAVKRLRSVGITVFGAVVNGTKPVRSRRAVDRSTLLGSANG